MSTSLSEHKRELSCMVKCSRTVCLLTKAGVNVNICSMENAMAKAGSYLVNPVRNLAIPSYVKVISKGVKGLLDLIYPLTCQVCKIKLDFRNITGLCESCWKKIQKNSPPFCSKCGKSLPGPSQDSLICGECLKKKFYFHRAWSVCLYEGVVKECIHLFKYSRRLCLLRPFSQLMIEFVRDYLDHNRYDFLVPVPLHKVKLREREFNQSLLLAQSVSRAFNLPLSTNNLRRIRTTPSQTQLNLQQRLTNIKGSFGVKDGPRLKDKRFLLVDDVFTTGSTVDECSKVLLKAGAKRVEVLTLARGQ